ncbi:hypothetical protein H8L32_17440 [Undibacterium sp. CY18W]|uniref:Uncharacterized protein n=1 Tax=Undibacterium hunanense TaxID=2762292 RepID=A0ABR6ZTU5_9BURK|nr:hypothetical protein [Undibacterium hunanense]MBC3919277.1 hypothetical protein [Undibacterium hunanense]
MKFTDTDQLITFLRQSAHEFYYLCRKAFAALMGLPLPHLLLICVAIALALTILPLALSLFIAFLIFKVLIVLLAVSLKKNRQQSKQLQQEP